ncbi:MAG: hypothetical protein ACI4U3_05670 [Traorella sp.]
MERFIKIKQEVDKIYDQISDPLNRDLCKLHHQQVLKNIQNLTTNECLYIAAYMHDIGLYLGLIGNHALTSAHYTYDFLKKTSLFSEDELNLIYQVILVHSKKNQIHFLEAELLKQADKQASLEESM